MTNEGEFVRIYNDFYRKVLEYLARIVGPDEAEDLTQDVFDKINRSLPDFKGKSKISTWVYRIATNAAVDRLRSAAYKQSLGTAPIQDTSESDAHSADNPFRSSPTDEIVIRKEMIDCVKEFIGKLPLNYKTVLVLSDLLGMSHQQIADILELSSHNVKIRLHRAREKLKIALREGCEFYYNEEGTLACDRKQVDIFPKMPK